jgi:hypothetical protein
LAQSFQNRIGKIAPMNIRKLFILLIFPMGILSTQAQEFPPPPIPEVIAFSDTGIKVKDFINHHGEWVVIAQNNTAYYYGHSNENIISLDTYVWKYKLSASGFVGKVWFDNEHVYFGNAKSVERVGKYNGSMIDELPFENINSAPFYDGKNLHFIAPYKGKMSQICYRPGKKKGKILWTAQTYKNFTTPVYSERFIITRDSTNFPITLSYEKGEVMLPEKYENACPFPSWVDMFNIHGNDPSDSFFYYNGYIYAISPYYGILRRFEPKNYPIPLVSVDMNKLTKKGPFNFSQHSLGSMIYTREGIHFITNEEMDSLQKTQRKGPFGEYMPSIPISKYEYYKIKSTTILGNFGRFADSRFIGTAEDNRYFVFEGGGQLIGVSPQIARTYNFPNLGAPIKTASTHPNYLYYYQEGMPYLYRIKLQRIYTQEEIEAMQPSPEILEMLRQREAEIDAKSK